MKFEPRKKGLLGYLRSESLIIGGVNHGAIAWGGTNSRFLVQVNGEASNEWSKLVSWCALGDHDPETGEEPAEKFALLARADVCFDWLDDRDVKSLSAAYMAAVEAAPGRKVQWRQEGDWLTEEGRLRGCTLYMGSRTSSVQIRLYDKGLEQIGKLNEAPANLRRIEVQVRPAHRHEREGWVLLPAEHFWKVSRASSAAADHFGIGTAEGIARSYSVKTDIETQMMYASVQYGEAIVELVKLVCDSPEIAALVQREVQAKADLHKALIKRKQFAQVAA